MSWLNLPVSLHSWLNPPFLATRATYPSLAVQLISSIFQTAEDINRAGEIVGESAVTDVIIEDGKAFGSGDCWILLLLRCYHRLGID